MRARARAYTEETRRRISQVVVVTKTDLPEVEADAEAKLAALRNAVPHGRILSISAQSGDNLATLLKRTRALLDKLDERASALEAVPAAVPADDAYASLAE